MICINSSHSHLSYYFISINQNNKEKIKKTTVEIKLKEKQILIIIHACRSDRTEVAQPHKEWQEGRGVKITFAQLACIVKTSLDM